MTGAWEGLVAARARGDWPAAGRLAAQAPALAGLAGLAGAGGPVIVGQIGQSLDGRIAAPNGESRFINGPEALDHLHRLRALVDAVVVGAGTAAADDPGLTVRRVAGPDPVRVVLDPRARLGPPLRLFTDGLAPTLRIAGTGACPEDESCLPLPLDDGGRFDPAAVRDGLAVRGLTRLLIEGGANTLAGFVEAGLLDRLHILVGPMILGAGQNGLDLAGIAGLDQAIRPEVTVHRLGGDTLFDCRFR